MSTRISGDAWIVEGLIDQGRGILPMALALTRERVFYILRVPPPLVLPEPDDEQVPFAGTLIEGETAYSPAIVLCDRIGHANGRRALRMADSMVAPWLLSGEDRIRLVRRLGKTPLRHFSNRCHDLLRATIRSVAWDPSARSLLAAIPKGPVTLDLASQFAKTFGQGPGNSAHLMVVRIAEMIPVRIRTATTQPALDPDVSAGELDVIRAFEEAGRSPDMDDATKVARPGGSGRPGISGGGASTNSPRQSAAGTTQVRPQNADARISVDRAGQLSGHADVARIVQDMRSDEDGGVGPLWDGPDPVHEPVDADSSFDDGFDIDAVEAFESLGRAGGEDGASHETTDKQRKGSYRQKGLSSAARPGGPSGKPKSRRRVSRSVSSGPRPR